LRIPHPWRFIFSGIIDPKGKRGRNLAEKNRDSSGNEKKKQDQHNGGFARQLGLTSALAIGLGTMMGAGLFVLAPQVAGEAGPGATITYILAGLIVLPSAMVVSELATAMPQEGGSYHLISRTVGPLAAAIVGPANWLGLTFATGFYLIGFTRFFAAVWDIPDFIVILAIGAGFIYLNYRGAQATGSVQNVIVAAVVLVLLVFIGRGLFEVERELHSPFIAEGWGSVISAIGLIIVSFTGFEKVSSVAEEIKKPGRNLPIAIIGSVIIATVLYAGTLFVFTGVIGAEAMQAERPLVDAGEAVWGSFGEIMMLFGGLLATASSANAAIMSSSRINFAMGRDRILPSWFGAINEKHRTPHNAIYITGGLAVVLALSGAAEVLAEIGSALFLISYALMAMGVLLMRSTKPEWYKPAFRVPLYPWLPLAGGIAALAVIITMETLSQVAGLGLAGASLIFYFAWGRKRNNIDSQLQRALEHQAPGEIVKRAFTAGEVGTAQAGGEEEAAPTIEREILVGAGSVEVTRRLLRVAALIAKGRGRTGLRLVKVKTVPQTVAKKYADEHFTEEDIDPDHILRDSRQSAPVDGINLETETQLSRSIAGGLLQVAENNDKVDMVFLGWSGEVKPDSLGARIDKEIGTDTHVPLAVLVERDLTDLKRILVLGGPHKHARLALAMATDIQSGSGAEMVIVQPRQEDGSVEQRQQDGYIREILGERQDRAEVRNLRGEANAADFLHEIQLGCDLVVIGSPENWSISDWVFGKLSDKIAREAKCPVLIVHHGQGEKAEEERD
jgi:basic amino acid/polyamine antiporter, APA family